MKKAKGTQVEQQAGGGSRQLDEVAVWQHLLCFQEDNDGAVWFVEETLRARSMLLWTQLRAREVMPNVLVFDN